MGLRFRKSFKIAPGVKLNLNKNSTSITFGKRGAHYTVNSKGKKTASVGIPGTGISYTMSTGSRTSSKKTTNQGGPNMFQNNFPDYNGNNKKWYQKTGWIIALIILFFPVGLFLMWKYTDWKKPVKFAVTAFILFFAIVGLFSPDNLEEISLSANTTSAYDINQEVTITVSTTPNDYKLSDSDFKCTGGKLNIENGTITFLSSSSGSYEIWAEHDEIKSNELVIKVEDKKAIAESVKMVSKKSRSEVRRKKHMKLRNRFSGTAQRPRLAVFRSNNHMYAQIIDDTVGNTLVSASTLQKEVKAELEKTNDVEAAAYLGKVIAERAKAKGIDEVVFDRGGFIYQGKIKALADAAREAGLNF